MRKEAIEAIILTLLENTDWDQDKVIEKVSILLEIPTSKVVKILEDLDF